MRGCWLHVLDKAASPKAFLACPRKWWEHTQVFAPEILGHRKPLRVNVCGTEWLRQTIPFEGWGSKGVELSSCIHWLIFVCALIGDRIHNLGLSGQRSRQGHTVCFETNFKCLYSVLMDRCTVIYFSDDRCYVTNLLLDILMVLFSPL